MSARTSGVRQHRTAPSVYTKTSTGQLRVSRTMLSGMRTVVEGLQGVTSQALLTFHFELDQRLKEALAGARRVHNSVHLTDLREKHNPFCNRARSLNTNATTLQAGNHVLTDHNSC